MPEDTIYQFDFRTDSTIIKVEAERTDLPKPIMRKRTISFEDNQKSPDSMFVVSSSTRQYNDAGSKCLRIIPDKNPGCYILTGSTGSFVNETTTMKITDNNGKLVFQSTVIAPAGYLYEKFRIEHLETIVPYCIAINSRTFNENLLPVAN